MLPHTYAELTTVWYKNSKSWKRKSKQVQRQKTTMRRIEGKRKNIAHHKFWILAHCVQWQLPVIALCRFQLLVNIIITFTSTILNISASSSNCFCGDMFVTITPPLLLAHTVPTALVWLRLANPNTKNGTKRALKLVEQVDRPSVRSSVRLSI